MTTILLRASVHIWHVLTCIVACFCKWRLLQTIVESHPSKLVKLVHPHKVSKYFTILGLCPHVPLLVIGKFVCCRVGVSSAFSSCSWAARSGCSTLKSLYLQEGEPRVEARYEFDAPHYYDFTNEAPSSPEGADSWFHNRESPILDAPQWRSLSKFQWPHLLIRIDVLPTSSFIMSDKGSTVMTWNK